MGEDDLVFDRLDRKRKAYIRRLKKIVGKRRRYSREVRRAAAERLIANDDGSSKLNNVDLGLEVRAASSFSRAIWTLTRKNKIGCYNWEITLQDKLLEGRLAKCLGASLPNRYGPFTIDEALEAVHEAKRPVVIKPSAGGGSRGVFLVHSKDRVYALQREEWLQDGNELGAKMASVKRFGKGPWLVEEFIPKQDDALTPAPDLKFYCFYGRVGLVLEVERYPRIRYCWRNRAGEAVITGQYNDKLFNSRPVTSEQIEFVETMSAKLPATFMRLDFLKSGSGLYFGEFTPKPGDYNSFNDEYNFKLGDMYLDADVRLKNDLLMGKQFPEFTEVFGRSLEIARKAQAERTDRLYQP